MTTIVAVTLAGTLALKKIYSWHRNRKITNDLLTLKSQGPQFKNEGIDIQELEMIVSEWLFSMVLKLNQLYEPLEYVTREGSTDGYFQYSSSDWKNVNAFWISLLYEYMCKLTCQWSLKLVYSITMISREINLSECVDWSLLKRPFRATLFLPLNINISNTETSNINNTSNVNNTSNLVKIPNLGIHEWLIIKNCYMQMFAFCNLIILQQRNGSISNISQIVKSLHSGIVNVVMPLDLLSPHDFPAKSEILNEDFHLVIDRFVQLKAMICPT